VKASVRIAGTAPAAARGVSMVDGATEMLGSSPSLHNRIVADIEGRILSGDWPPGNRIPYEHELTGHYGCSRMTVSKALAQLVRAGLIERRRKAGSFVARPRSQSALLEIRDVAAEVAALNLAYAYALLGRRKRRATRADRERLGVEAGTSVLSVICRHDAGGRPFCREDRLISLTTVPDAADEPFDTVAPGPWLLAQAQWTSAEHRIRAAAADHATAETLRVTEGAPCLIVERRTSTSEQPVTHVRFTYPANAHELVASFTPSRAEQGLRPLQQTGG
jgi:GntR family histidine utilization transcriptional repressor